MAAGKRGRKKHQPTPDDVAALTALTREELGALAEELEKEMCVQDKEIHKLIPESVLKEMEESEVEEDGPESLKEYLKDARYHLPLDLVGKLQILVEHLLKARTPKEIKYDRWLAVRHAVHFDAVFGRLSGELHNPYAMASFFLRDTAAEASAQMVELDYLAFEQSLPAAERYPIRRKGGRRRNAQTANQRVRQRYATFAVVKAQAQTK